LTDTLLQSADKDQQEVRAVAEKPHDAVVKFDTYRNVQRHRAVLPAIARLLFSFLSFLLFSFHFLFLSLHPPAANQLSYIRSIWGAL